MNKKRMKERERERLSEGKCVSVPSIAGSGPGRRETAD